MAKKYSLVGFVGRWNDSHSDPGYWEPREDLKVNFEAKSNKEAIDIARKKVDEFLERYKAIAPDLNFRPKHNFDEDNRECHFELTRTLWKQDSKPYEAGERARPARPDKPARLIREIF